MLKIPKSVEYSLLALKYISDNPENECISARKISSELDIPFEILAKILQKLVKGNIIYSLQGKSGGYIFQADPSEVSLKELIELVESPVQFTNCSSNIADNYNCDRAEKCCIKDSMIKINSKINEIFKKTFLEEIIK